jgi:hypothetical protein
MYRDHVWTSTLRRLLVAHMNAHRSQGIPLLGILLLCSSFGWSQSYTFVQGSATACAPGHQYKKLGFGDISRKTSDSCSRGTGTASSKASFVHNLVAMGTTAAYDGIAGANGEDEDVITLKPPKGFKGNTVQFSYTDAFAFSISGLGGENQAQAFVCWTIFEGSKLKFKECKSSTTNGNSRGQVHHDYVLTKSGSGFQISTLKSASVAITAGPQPPRHITTGSISPGHFHLILPKGWTCKYGSGTACP